MVSTPAQNRTHDRYVKTHFSRLLLQCDWHMRLVLSTPIHLLFHVFLSPPFPMMLGCFPHHPGHYSLPLDTTSKVYYYSFHLLNLLPPSMVYHIHSILFPLLVCVSPHKNLATPSRLPSPATCLVYKMPAVARKKPNQAPRHFPALLERQSNSSASANSSLSGSTPMTFSSLLACDTHPSDRADRILC